MKEFKEDLRGNLFFFTQKVVNIWKALPEEMVKLDKIAVFKKDLDGSLKDEAKKNMIRMWVNGIIVNSKRSAWTCWAKVSLLTCTAL